MQFYDFVSDFGMAYCLPRAFSYTETPVHNSHYSPPEMIEEKPYDPKKADIWNWSVTIHSFAQQT